MSDEFDIAIVGGGLLGAALGYGMADGQRRIAMLDEGDSAFRAARGNFGLVWVQGKGMGSPAYMEWTRASAAAWPQLAAAIRHETGIDVALAQRGGLHLCLSDAEAEARRLFVARLLAQPGGAVHAIEMLDPAQLSRLVPGIGREVVAGSHCALDGHLNPLKLWRGLHEGFARRGGSYLPQSGVTAITRTADGFELKTAERSFRAERVVIAAGLGSDKLARQVGIAVPVRPQRGHVIALERAQPFLELPIETLRQTDEGTFLIGDSQDEPGLSEATASGILAAMAARAVRMIPALRGVRVIRTWAALRVLTPDGFPLYQASRTHPGAFVATCHSGVTLAAVHALRLAPQLAAGRLDADLEPFSGERFGVPAAA